MNVTRSVALGRYALKCCADLSAAEVAFRRIPNDDPNGCFLPVVIEQIRLGKYALCEITDENKRLGFTCYTFETFGNHKELVSIATTLLTKEPLRVQVSELLRELARVSDCKSIRLHTARQGLVRDALTIGYHVAEITLRKYL